MIGTFDYAAPEQLDERRRRRAHRRLRARRRALPGAHGQGPVPARDAPRRRCSPTSTRRRRRSSTSCPDARERARRVVVRRAMAKDPRRPLPVGRRARPRRAGRRATGDARRRSAASPPATPRRLEPRRARDPAPARAGRSRPAAGRSSAAPSALDAARAPLRRAAEAASASSCCSRGEPGIGKTRLASRARARARTHEGATVLYGRSDPESLRPLPAVHHRAAALRGQPRARCALPPELALELTELARFVPACAGTCRSCASRSPRSRRRAATGCSRRVTRAARPSSPASARSC